MAVIWILIVLNVNGFLVRSLWPGHRHHILGTHKHVRILDLGVCVLRSLNWTLNHRRERFWENIAVKSLYELDVPEYSEEYSFDLLISKINPRN